MKDNIINTIANIVLIIIILLSCFFVFLYNKGCLESNEERFIREEKIGMVQGTHRSVGKLVTCFFLPGPPPPSPAGYAGSGARYAIDEMIDRITDWNREAPGDNCANKSKK